CSSKESHMNKVFTLKNVVAASLLAGAGIMASAQTAPVAPAAAPQRAAAPAAGHGHWDPAKMHEARAKRHAQRMADFKTVLRITPNQEGAWNAFTAAMAPQNRGGMMAHRSPEERAKLRADFDKMSTPERMEKMRALRAERM